MKQVYEAILKQQREEVVRMRAKGMSAEDIADCKGITRTRVYQLLKGHDDD